MENARVMCMLHHSVQKQQAQCVDRQSRVPFQISRVFLLIGISFVHGCVYSSLVRARYHAISFCFLSRSFFFFSKSVLFVLCCHTQMRTTVETLV
jgi:hypothetical protein